MAILRRRLRFTQGRMMFVIVVLAICIVVGQYALRLRKEQRLRLELEAKIAASKAEVMLVSMQAITGTQNRLIRAEEWHGNPLRPNRSTGRPLSLDEMQKDEDELKECQAELDKAVAALLQRATQPGVEP